MGYESWDRIFSQFENELVHSWEQGIWEKHWELVPSWERARSQLVHSLTKNTASERVQVLRADVDEVILFDPIQGSFNFLKEIIFSYLTMLYYINFDQSTFTVTVTSHSIFSSTHSRLFLDIQLHYKSTIIEISEIAGRGGFKPLKQT